MDRLKYILGVFSLFFLTVAISCSSLGASRSAGERTIEPRSVLIEKDDLVRAYHQFALSAIYSHHGESEKARRHLLEALREDPESSYLNKKMAMVLAESKDLKGAEKYALKAVELDPENVESRMLLAEIQSRLGNAASARKQYEEILAIRPDDKKVGLVLVTALIRERDFQGALSHLGRLLETDPDLVIAHYYRGRIQLEIGDFKEAESSFKRAIELNEGMEPALFDLGSLYQMQKRYEDAAAVYEKLIGLYPANTIARERLIGLYYELGKEDLAESQMEELKKQSKPGDPGRQAVGLIYLKHGRLDESIAELDLIVRAFPDDDKSRYFLASAYEEKEDYQKALEHFRGIGEDSDYYVNARIHLAHMLNLRERQAEAADALREALQKHPDKPELYLMLASLYEEKEEYDTALRTIAAGLEQNQGHVELIFRKGVILDKQGKKEETIREMRKILELDPDHADALNYIGYTYAEQGIRLDEALDLIQKALRLKPDSGYIIDSLGWVYFQKGDYDEAMDSLEKAVTLTPDDPTISEHLGDVYFKKKKYEKALEMYQKALALNHPDKQKIEKKILHVREFQR